MKYLEDYSDERHKAWCIHCGKTLADVARNRDHVPSKSLLSKRLRRRGADYDRGTGGDNDYLPQVLVCRRCNGGFSPDENYLLCVLHAVAAGSLYPDPGACPEAAAILRSNRHVVRALKATPDGQLFLFDDLKPFTVYPDMRRIERVVEKNARGHAYHELGEPLLEPVDELIVRPIQTLDRATRARFEQGCTGLSLWPEVGSRMMLRLVEGGVSAGGWIDVEVGRYRYAIDWANGITVRSVIWDYLVTEARWRK